jgi:hypothetical protein
MLKLLLTEGYAFPAFDYGRTVNFKIYTEDDTPFDGSTYTAYARLFNEVGGEVIDEIQTAQVNSSGVGSFAFTPTKHPSATGPHYLEVQLEKSGQRISTERRRVIITLSPPGSRTP